MASRTTKAVVGVLVVGAVVVGAVFGLHSVWNSAKKAFAGETCTIGSYDLSPDQASVASQMVGAVTRYRRPLPDRAAVLVVAAALQESKLTNLPPGQGDRDSVGVLQQRPSQGWGGGSAQRLTDVGEATTEFLDKLVRVPGWQKLPLAEAVQDVQISADGTLYAQHEDEATALVRALLGRVPAGITCSLDKPGTVSSAASVAARARAELGIRSPVAPAPSTVRVPGAHWQTAAWLVANAKRFGIDRVAYAGRTWTRSDGWKATPSVPTTAVTATLYTKK